jgi:hypothetical protein
MRLTRLLFLVTFASTAACATVGNDRQLRQLSSPQLGCPADEVAVTDFKNADRAASWKAACKGGEPYDCELRDRLKGVTCVASPRARKAQVTAPK